MDTNGWTILIQKILEKLKVSKYNHKNNVWELRVWQEEGIGWDGFVYTTGESNSPLLK